jgi:hypothetical protein
MHLQNRSCKPSTSLMLLSALALWIGGEATWAATARPTLDRSTERMLRFEHRQALERKRRVFPLQAIPKGARQRALQQIQNAAPAQAAAGQPFWFNIGPSPIHGTAAPDAAGRVSAIAVDPSDSSHWLLGAAQGGVWESTDAGNSWSARSDDEASLAIGDIAFAPSNSSIVYAGTGEGNFSGDSYGGMGLLKSTDGGLTWSLASSTPFAQNAFSRIVVSPTDPKTLVVATGPAVLGVGVDGTNTPPAPPSTGIFASSDGGSSWTQTLTGQATDIAASPTTFNNQYAALGAIFGDPANGVYRTLDGSTWSLISGPWVGAAGGATGLGRIRIAIAPSNANQVYVSAASFLASTGFSSLLGIWMTQNAWDATPTWTLISNSGDLDPKGYVPWYSQNLLVSTIDPSVVYYAGFDISRFDGSTWMNLPDQHADQHGLAWQQGSNNVIATNDGGVSSMPDAGGAWTSHINDLSITQFYKGSVEQTDSLVILAGNQDNGTAAYNGTEPWNQVVGADGYSTAVDTVIPNNQWAASQEIQSGPPLLRTQDGINFSDATSGIDLTTVSFFMGSVMHPMLHDTFIAGSTNLWRATNFFSAPVSPQWTANSPTLQTAAQMPAEITAMAFAPSDATSQTYAYGTEDGQLRLTHDAGVHWTNINSTGAVPGRYVSGLAFSPTNANQLYVTLSGFDEGTPGHPGHVFKTVNALASVPAWSDVSPPVDLPQNSIAIDPTSKATVYVGSDIGVWRSVDGGTTWTHFGPSQGMPNVAVFDLQIDDTGGLTAFTHGRGAFRLGSVPIIIPPMCTALCLLPWIDPESLVVNPGDPAEFILPLVNISPVTGENITATLLPSTQVLPAGGSQVQSYGQLPASAGIVTQTFSFVIANVGAAGGAGAAAASAHVAPALRQRDGDDGDGGGSERSCRFPTANPVQADLTFALADNGTSLGSITLPFTLGTLVSALAQDFQTVTVPQLPEGWFSIPRQGPGAWVTSSAPPSNVLAGDPDEVNDKSPGTLGPVGVSAFSAGSRPRGSAYLVSPRFEVVTEHGTLKFRHSFNFDHASTGATLEIAIGEGPFEDILRSGGSFAQNGYNAVASRVQREGSDRSAADRGMWSGSSGGYLITKVNLPARAAGHSVRLRWRVLGLEIAPGKGWYVDDVSVKDYPLITPGLASKARRCLGTGL